MDIEIILSWPPTVNSYYTHTKRGTFISAKGRKYRENVAIDVREQLPLLETLEDGLCVQVLLNPPDKRKRDLDNHMKGLLDALTKASVWEDDSLIHQLMIYRGVIIPGGRCVMTITDAGPIIPMKI